MSKEHDTEVGEGRPIPSHDPATDFFWECGADGILRVLACTSCEALRHPPTPVCPDCGSDAAEPRAVSGRAVVAACTVNHQPWSPAFPTPYVVAIVELVEDPRVRILTNIVDCPERDVHVGMPVRARFEQRADTWIPVFAPDEGPDAEVRSAPPSPYRPRAVQDKFEDRVVLSGLGMSQVGRRLMRPPLALTVEACRRAIDDAGLRAADIDGVSTFPGALAPLGFGEGGTRPLIDALRLETRWVNGASETNGMSGAIVTAMLAVSAGLCRHVLCYRTVAESTQAVLPRRVTGSASPREVSGDAQWREPFGALSAPTWFALYASRYFAEYGDQKHALGRIAVNARNHAALNDDAIYRGPLSLEDYLAAREVSSPFGLYDCDVPCDGAVAVIVSAREVADDLRCPPVRVEAVGTASSERPSWDQGSLLHVPLVRASAEHLWTRTSCRPADVDVAQLYDGFSFTVFSWLESLGFCGIGEAGDFVGDGTRISLTGELPLNTSGGQLSGGRLHGFGLIHEAILQVRGEAGARQIADAELSLVATGGGMPGGCLLLRPD